MNKIKDIIYDYNDIFVALLIIVIAGAMLLWRVNAIMEYPEYLAQKAPETKQTQQDVDFTDVDLEPEDVDEKLNTEPEDVNSDALQQQQEQQQEQEPPKEETPQIAGDVKFEVPKGSSAAKIADLLRQAGLIDDQKEFLSKLAEMKADTKLKAGTFTIPAGSDYEAVIKILTK